MVAQQGNYPIPETIKWQCLAAESNACKGFSLRRMGYLTVALQEYKKSMSIVQRITAEKKDPAMTQFAREITSMCPIVV